MRDMEDYGEKVAAKDMEFERRQEYFRRNLVKKAIETYAPQGGSVLEIGCGLNPLFSDYQDEYQFTVVEPVNHFFKNAEHLAENYKHAVCYQGFFEDVAEKIKERSFDVIICAALLQEVEDPNRFLRAVQDLCSQSTIVHLNVPNAFSLHRLLAKEMGLLDDVHQFSERNHILQQQTVFDMESLKRLVRSENYQIIESGSIFLKPFSHKQMQQCIEHQILSMDVLEAMDRICESYMKEYGSEIYLNMRKMNR
ncbi:MAG: class I SAM-dependent methyltransferase [Eubacterium sp.]|jgi:2-polyprenyl-3-methyl-5-hydroxy-6-metoxy-1,4-benzoquinol methylase|nr:class I SAM-dependent methyltransferase [Eubacterium sp.]